MKSLAAIIGEDSFASLSSEQALALALSRRDFGADDVKHLKTAFLELDPQLSWGLFVDICARHGILPLVGRHLHSLDLTLGESGESLIPYRWLYSHVYAGNMQRNQILTSEYGHVLHSLNQAGMKYVVRKGPVTLEHIHGDIGVRRVGDMDLLVSSDELPRFEELVQHEGYECAHRTSARHELAPFDRATSAFWRLNIPNVHLPYLKVADSDLVEVFVVDFCLSLFQAKSGIIFDFNNFYQRSHPTRLWGVVAPAMDAEDQLIDLCVQFHTEATVLYYIELGKDITLLKLTEIAELVRMHVTSDDQVDRLIVRSEAIGCRQSLYYGLWHVSQLYPERVGEELVDRLGAGIDKTILSTFGDLDGSTQTWESPFMERLFNVGRAAGAHGASSVPGPRAVI